MPPSPPSRRDLAVGPGRSGPDACPGALQLHQAADGALARIRCPGGLLTAAQLTALTEAAGSTGAGYLELTSRANVQLRGLSADAARLLVPRLTAAGLLPSVSHERVRNIVGSPLCGVDAVSVWDVPAQVRALDAAVCADPRLARLSGRFLFAVDDGRGDTAAARPDIALLPDESGQVTVLLAGADHGVRTGRDTAVALAVAAANAFLDEQVGSQDGSDVAAWRLADLAEPVLRRVGTRLAAHPAARPTGSDQRQRHRSGPGRSTDMSARAAAGVLARPDGGYGLAVVVPLGRLRVEQAELLAAAAGDNGGAGHGDLRLTPWRAVVLPRVADATGWARRLDAAGLVTEPDSPWLGVTCCAGRPGCARSRADVRADATAVHAAPVGPAAPAGHAGRLPVHWIGCERGCGTPGGAVVRVLATGDGYQVTTPGRPVARTAPGAGLIAAVHTAREAP
ncbi:precorrin-3B synthase [Solwaraspora sp. WMMB335]|uniref:precorrin-3B synthase n=1 Tax=Solwaraspora sp. WMMB335 TaxID=3404118 RepID=UPI003B9490CA